VLDDHWTRHAAAALDPLDLPELAGSVRVVWNSRLRTSAGRAWPGRALIELNPAIRPYGDDEIRRTLLHELAHLIAHVRSGRRRIAPHGAEWRQACRDLGIPGESARHRLPLTPRRQQRRHSYRCPACGQIIRRARRLRTPAACLPCCRTHAQGRYDPRFRLVPVTP
jgi:predicted SprT family Zn-dependent metalloprotease